MNKTVRIILTAILGLVFLAASTMLVYEMMQRRISAGYVGGLQLEYEPEIPLDDEGRFVGHQSGKDLSNEKLQNLVDQYPDVVCWLTVKGADVSDPVAQGSSNNTYLRSDLDGNYLLAGTIFMDFRNSRDFSDPVTVIYGHNMTDGIMFGQVEKYRDFNYLMANPDVYISTPEDTVHYTVIACTVVDAYDGAVYQNIGGDDCGATVAEYLDTVSEKNPEVYYSTESSYLVLSTCSYQYDTARTVIICVKNND